MIGVFDSGSGGLTVLKALREVMPGADYLYFGDLKNAPYGGKARDELSHLTVEALSLLKKRGAERIVSACNSVSASLAVSLLDAFSIAPSDLIEMVGPTVSYFRNSSARILLVATEATVASGIYQDGFRMIGKEVVAIPIPELAGALEADAPKEKLSGIIASAFSGISLSDFDVLILACTHYPLVYPLFTERVPTSLLVFDPAFAVAERAKKQFWPKEAGDGTVRFLISRDSAVFRKCVDTLFPGNSFPIEII